MPVNSCAFPMDFARVFIIHTFLQIGQLLHSLQGSSATIFNLEA